MDNNYDEIDNLFSRYFENNQEVPNVITNGIKTAMSTHKNKYDLISLIEKIIITIVSILTVTGGIVFAKEIGEFIGNIFNTRKGISTAINNGYIESPNMKYVESNDINVKVKNILMDDYNFNINFELNLNINDVSMEQIQNINISQIIIYDENNNILYCNSQQLFDGLVKDKRINLQMDKFNEKKINSGVNYYISEKEVDNNKLNIVYNLSSYDSTYPRSKKIYINIAEITVETAKEKMYTNGQWFMELDIPDKFYNREAIIYRQKSSNDEKIEVTKAIVYDTGLKFELKIKEHQNIENGNSSTLWEEMDKEFLEYQNKENLTENRLCTEGKHHYIGSATEEFMTGYNQLYKVFTDIYIENEKGQRFYITESTSEDGIIDRTSNENYFTYSDTFDITKYDITENLKIHFKYKNENKIIEIKK